MNRIECSSRGGFGFGLIVIGHCGGAVAATSGLEGTDSLVSFNSAVFEPGAVMGLFEESWLSRKHGTGLIGSVRLDQGSGQKFIHFLLPHPHVFSPSLPLDPVDTIEPLHGASITDLERMSSGCGCRISCIEMSSIIQGHGWKAGVMVGLSRMR